MLVNLSNHPSVQWDSEQLEAAAEFGEILDLGFPFIDPSWNEVEISELADNYAKICLAMFSDQRKDCVVHIMGEMTFCFYIVSYLEKRGIKCIASTAARESLNDGSLKLSEFRFIRFRQYISPTNL
jgi:hypothetical protein